MASKQYPEWAKTLYRGLRAGISAGFVSAWAIQPDWSKPEESFKIVAIAFGTGFAVAFGKWLREFFDSEFGFDANSVISKVMFF
jgi:hypothetical protein